MASDYLHTCLSLHRAVTELRFKNVQPLDRVERDVQAVFAGRLTYEVHQRILNPKLWNPGMFGYWPPDDELKRAFGAGWDLSRLPDGEDEMIRKLLEVYRQIEPVSVVLRFVKPKHYGIVSPPVEKILGIGPRRRQNDRYQKYVDSLRELRKCRGFQTAAEVDMALWALQVGVLDGFLKRHGEHGGKAAEIERAFKEDVRLRQLRARNLIKPLFDELSKLQLAEALIPTDLEIAGQIAGIDFEYWVRRWLGTEPNERDGLHKVISDSCDQCGALYDDMQSARTIRNDAIHHPDNLTTCRVRLLIETAKKVRESYRAERITRRR